MRKIKQDDEMENAQAELREGNPGLGEDKAKK